MIKRLFLILIIIFPYNLFAQTDASAVKSIEGITNKMLALISGEIGEDRDWDEFRNLFLPTAQMVVLNKNAPPQRQVQVMNLEEFIRNIGPYYKRDGFEEMSIGLEVNEFNGIANVFQSFYCRNLIGTYEERGINNYQLVFSDDRWWISSTSFTNATAESPVPDEYLFEEHKSKN